MQNHNRLAKIQEWYASSVMIDPFEATNRFELILCGPGSLKQRKSEHNMVAETSSVMVGHPNVLQRIFNHLGLSIHSG